MDVQDFAPAVLSLADLVQHSVRIAYGDAARARIRVRSDLRKGSLVASFDLYLEGAQQIAAFVVGTYGLDFSTLLQVIGLHKSSRVTLFGLLKWLKGRKERQVITQGNGNIAVHVEGDDNTVLVVPPEVHALYRDDHVRRAAYGVARPLEQEGISTLEFKEGRKLAERVRQEDVKSLQAAVRRVQPERLPQDGEILESEEMLTVDLLQGVFSEGESFRFFDGESKFWARISDQDWWSGIHARTDGYYEGDRMRVRLIVRQGTDSTGSLFKEREITEVLWHEHKPRQTDLFDANLEE